MQKSPSSTDGPWSAFWTLVFEAADDLRRNRAERLETEEAGTPNDSKE